MEEQVDVSMSTNVDNSIIRNILGVNLTNNKED